MVPSHGVPLPTSFPLLYVSPDQILPLTSFLGAALGVVLMFWNRLVGAFRKIRKPSSRQ
jgi:hypothetical protein